MERDCNYEIEFCNVSFRYPGTEKDGLETFLYKDFDDGGVEISGSEAQKIAIARALYKDAAFLILDEPTAALAPVAEYEVYTKFNEIVGERTAIYISHRLASCRFCNEIAVFDQGRVCQRGSHGKLLADTGGKYYALWHAQAQYYEKEKRRIWDVFVVKEKPAVYNISIKVWTGFGKNILQ